MITIIAGLVLVLAFNGCASLSEKCVDVWMGEGARTDIMLGPWASISQQGPSSLRTQPKDATCQFPPREPVSIGGGVGGHSH